jgi:hypothetical protein
MNLRALAVAALGLALGCAPPSAKDVAKDTATEVTGFVRGALAAAHATNGLESVALMTRGFSTASTGQASQMSPPVSPAPETYDPTLDEISKFVTEHVFTEANVESTEGGATIFRLMGDDLCAGTPPDASCVDSIDRLEVRVKVVSPAPGAYDFTLLLGAERHAPLVFRIRKQQSLTLEVELAQAKAAAALVASFTGSTTRLPRVAEGVLQVMLEKTGPRAYRLSESVLSAARLELDSDGATIAFSTAAAAPLSSIEVDGEARRMRFSLVLGETELSAPYHQLFSSAEGTSAATQVPVTVHLGGASYTFDFSAGQTEAVLSHLGLGEVTTWASYGGTRIFSADLNPHSGRHFELRFTPDADGLPIVSVNRELDLALEFHLSALAPTGATIDPWLADQTHTVKLDGAPSFKPVERVGQSSGALKLLTGTLRLGASEPGVEPVVVTAGQCLTSSSAPLDGGHPFSRVGVEACP